MMQQAVLTQRTHDLLVELPGGRALARAKQHIDNDTIRELVSTHLGADTKISLQAVRGTGTREETQQTDAKDFLSDPAVRRIVTGLQATILTVEDLPTEPRPEDP